MRVKELGVILMLAVSQIGFASGERTCSVGGRVLKASNQDEGIDGVEITIYRNKKEISNGHSAKDGSYSISCAIGSTITVRYDSDDYAVSDVVDISGQDAHKLYKTLLAKSKSFTFSEVQEIVATLERVYELDKANNTIAKHSSNYLSLLRSLDEKAPPELKSRIRLLRDRYSTMMPRSALFK